MLADRAGVVEDYIRVSRFGCEPIAQSAEPPRYELGIQLVHLTAKGFQVDGAGHWGNGRFAPCLRASRRDLRQSPAFGACGGHGQPSPVVATGKAPPRFTDGPAVIENRRKKEQRAESG